MCNFNIKTVPAVLRGLEIQNYREGDKVMAHCKLYLAQSLGLNLGFKFNLDKGDFGPESEEFKEILKAKTEDFVNIKYQNTDHELSDTHKKIIDKVISLDIGETREKGYSEVMWYALLACIVYIDNNYYRKGLLYSKFIDYIDFPEFRKKHFDRAVKILNAAGFRLKSEEIKALDKMSETRKIWVVSL